MQRGDRLLFDDVNLLLENGDLLWIVGENGVGKTTLLKIAAGLLRPDNGEASWRAAHHPASADQAIAFLSHKGHAKAGLTLAEDFTFWAELSTGRDVDTHALWSVGLGEALNTPTQNLSAGQRRRLSLAKLLISDRSVWIMDEPMAGLDAAGRKLVAESVAGHIARGGAAMIASHNPAEITAPNIRRLTLAAQLEDAI